MDMYERKNRIAEALSIRNMRQVELVEKTGLSKSAINNWSKNKWQPKQTPLVLMAKALDVSELWLAGYDVPMERPVSQKKMDKVAEVTEKLKNSERLYSLVDSVMELDEDNLLIIEAMVNKLSSK